MATIQFKRGNEYLTKISRLDRGLKDQVLGPAIYNGAEIVTDAIKDAIRALPTDNRFVRNGDMTRGPNPRQKAGLIASLGIAKMREKDGFWDVKIGFDGYNDIHTKRWPRGQPNQMVARSIERGTSWMRANPFVKKALAKTRRKAIEAMGRTVDYQIEKIMKE